MGDRLGIHGAVDILLHDNNPRTGWFWDDLRGRISWKLLLSHWPAPGLCDMVSADFARQMAGRNRDRAGGDFCFSAFLTLANTPSPGLGTQDSWTPARERKTEARKDQFDKYRGEDEKMDPLDQSGVGGIWRQSFLV